MSVQYCAICNHPLEGENKELCSACPIGPGCSGICCPNCGYTSVDVEGSRLARWFSGLLASRTAPNSDNDVQTLAQAPSGSRVQVCRFQGMPARQIENLQAYGLVPGCWVRIRQQKPATVVEVNHTELAIEPALARCVIINETPPTT